MSSPGTGTRRFFAHSNALVDTDDIGENTRIWAFAHVMKGAHIGRDCNIGETSFVEAGAWLGNNVTVKNGVAVWGGVTAEDDVFLGPNCVLTNDFNPRAYIKKTPEHYERTLLRQGATVGANATIVCGVTVGRYAFIGAGAVVLRSLVDYALVVGNPARQVGWMCYCARRLPLAPDAAVGEVCQCEHCHRAYLCSAGGLVEEQPPGKA